MLIIFQRISLDIFVIFLENKHIYSYLRQNKLRNSFRINCDLSVNLLHLLILPKEGYGRQSKFRSDLVSGALYLQCICFLYMCWRNRGDFCLKLKLNRLYWVLLHNPYNIMWIYAMLLTSSYILCTPDDIKHDSIHLIMQLDILWNFNDLGL